jgi:hypothetical protein
LVYFIASWYILSPFGIFYRHLIYFIAIWYILSPFDIFYGPLVYIFPFWNEKSGHPVQNCAVQIQNILGYGLSAGQPQAEGPQQICFCLFETRLWLFQASILVGGSQKRFSCLRE